MSETGFEQAVPPSISFASSSIIFQFSGAFRPLPAETTLSASVNEISLLFFSSLKISVLDSKFRRSKSPSVIFAVLFVCFAPN